MQLASESLRNMRVRKHSIPTGCSEVLSLDGRSCSSLLSYPGAILFLSLSPPWEKLRSKEVHIGQIIPQEPISLATTFNVPARDLPMSLHSGNPKDMAYQAYIVLPGPNAVYQPRIPFTISMSPYNIPLSSFQGNKARRSVKVKLSSKNGNGF